MPRQHQPLNSPSIGDYWAILGRRFWWILLPLFICWAIIWSLSWLLPVTYRSEALILVEQQKVPENYVASNVTVNLQDRLQSMTQQILSRTRLQTTIDRFHLYPPDNGLGRFARLADPVEQMRQQIKIELVQSPGHRGELTAFKIEYSARSPDLAQQVNNELTSLFIDENLRSQQQLSESTTAFLNSQLAEARAKLEKQEAKVRAFKATHFSVLPSQMPSNIQILSGLQGQLQTIQRDADGARQHKLYLESLLEQYQSQRVGQGRGDLTSLQELDRELTDLRLRLAKARSQYTEDHPDVIALEVKIFKTEKLEKQIQDEIASNRKANKGRKAADLRAESMQQGSTASVMQIQSQLEANQLEIRNYEQQQKDIESRISAYQARLNLTPRTEQELADVSRGYEESMSNYRSLLQKQMQSELATSLERRQQGEQFRILDPPSLPTKPSSSNHLNASLSGLILGAIIGLGLAALLELTDMRVRQERDLEGLVPAPVLVSIPHLSKPGEDRQQMLRRWIEIGAAVQILLLIVAGNIYALYKG